MKKQQLLKNKTVNQHYISQVEQKIHSIRKNGKESDKIYMFEILNHEKCLLSEPYESNIKNNLSYNDLFTFNYDRKSRESLENLFNKYESNSRKIIEVIENTDQRHGHYNIGDDLINLFFFKMIGTFRNPLNIKKTLNTIGKIADFKFKSNLVFQEAYNKIDLLASSKCNRICNEFKISESDYKRWLKSLLLLLFRQSDENNFIEIVLKQLFLSKDSICCIHVIRSEDSCFFMSDRGFTSFSEDNKNINIGFSIKPNLYIHYGFIYNIGSVVDVPEYMINKYFEKVSRNKKEIQVTFKNLNKEGVNRINEKIIFFSDKYVYGSQKDIFCKMF